MKPGTVTYFSYSWRFHPLGLPIENRILWPWMPMIALASKSTYGARAPRKSSRGDISADFDLDASFGRAFGI